MERRYWRVRPGRRLVEDCEGPPLRERDRLSLRERGLSRALSPRPLPRWWCPLRRLAGEWELRELDSDELEQSERELEEGDREGDDRE